MRLRVASVLLTSVVLAACGGDSKPKSDLEAWGIDPNLGPVVDGSGKPLAAGYNPLGRAKPVMLPRKQIFFSGLNWNVSANQGSHALVLPESGTNVFTTPTWADTDYSWAQNPHASAACDLDGSGLEKAVSIVFVPTATLKQGDNAGSAKLVIVDGGTGHTEVAVGSGFHMVISGSTDERNYLTAIACGDIDGDGADEIAGVVGNTLVVLDDAAHKFRQLANVDYRAGDYATNSQFHPTRVAVGDINGDGTDEIVTVDGTDGSSGSHYYVYGGAAATRLDSGAVLSNGTPSAGIQYGNVALGDVDADGLEEVIFAGDDTDDSSNTVVVLARWSIDTGGLVFSKATFRRSVGTWSNRRVVPLTAFNADGFTPANTPTDKSIAYSKARIVVIDSILTYEASSDTLVNSAYNGATNVGTPYHDLIAAGDVNGDGKEEVILFDVDNRNLRVYGNNTAGKFVLLNSPPDVGEDTSYTPSLCLVDLVGHSVVATFKGPSELRFSDPKVVAVLASPPYWSDAVNKDVMGNCGTSIGQSTSSGNTATGSFSVQASWTVGFDVEAPLFGSDLGSMRATQTIGASFSFSAAKRWEKTVSRSFTAAAGEDHVIFSSVPFDVYTYEVLRSPDPKVKGTTFTVSIPRSPQLVAMEKSLFNGLPGNPTKIDATVLGHTIGDPLKYPSQDAMRTLTKDSGLWNGTGTRIGVGAGFLTDEISIVSGKDTTVGVGFSYTFASEVVTGGALFGTSYGFSSSFDYTISTSTGTTYTGQIPYLPAGTAAGREFTVGIGAFEKTVPSQQLPFIVVGYWVKP